MDSMSHRGALGESGQTWTVESSSTFIHFRVWSNMSNGDHGGVKLSFTQFKSQREKNNIWLLRVENRVLIRDIYPMC